MTADEKSLNKAYALTLPRSLIGLLIPQRAYYLAGRLRLMVFTDVSCC